MTQHAAASAAGNNLTINNFSKSRDGRRDGAGRTYVETDSSQPTRFRQIRPDNVQFSCRPAA